MLITRSEKPTNLEAHFASLAVADTANSTFFVRNHFPAPVQNKDAWHLSIGGAVDSPCKLSLEDLKALPTVTHRAVLECAGNSRLFLDSKPDGLQWELGAVGCAEWTGVPLASVLQHAKINPRAVDIIFEGADHGTPDKPTRPKQDIHYARSIPVAMANNPAVMLAFVMNREPLPDAHGAPVRLIVPGWYGMASVKWLARIVVAGEPFHGYFQTVEYAYWVERNGNPPERLPVTQMSVKSEIAYPCLHERIPAGTPYRITGAAWSADGEIQKVELSVDDGATWHPATLTTGPSDHAWVRWEFPWTPQQTGIYILKSRATDAHGNTQPAAHDENLEGYMVTHTLPINVEVIR